MMGQMCSEEIRFHKEYEQYGEFSNFYPCDKLIIDGKHWKTTEHYFQAQKFVGTAKEELIQQAKTPLQAFTLGQQKSQFEKPPADWAYKRIRVMEKALREKFSQNPYLMKLLLSTGEKKLIEHTSRDNFWGNGGNDSGQNMLGQLLMKIRDQNSNSYSDSHYSDKFKQPQYDMTKEFQIYPTHKQEQLHYTGNDRNRQSNVSESCVQPSYQTSFDKQQAKQQQHQKQFQSKSTHNQQLTHPQSSQKQNGKNDTFKNLGF